VGKLSAAHAHRLLTHNVIPRAYVATVVERVLRSAASGTGDKRLRRLVRRHVHLPVHEDPWQAPLEDLLHATLEAIEVSAPLWRAVLRSWARGQGTLGEISASYLEERYGAAGAPPEGWTPDALREAVDAVRGAMPGLAHNDVALMLCWLTGYVPLPEAESVPEPSPVEPPSPTALPAPRLGSVEHWQALFREVLEGLRHMAADSPVWEAVAAFGDALRALVDAKQSEREAIRDRLRRALDALRAEADVDPEYFAFTDIALWRTERAPLDRVPDLVLIAENLRQHLRRHRRLRTATPTTVSEGLALRMRLHTLESAALAAHARLAEELGGGTASEAPAPRTEKAPLTGEALRTEKSPVTGEAPPTAAAEPPAPAEGPGAAEPATQDEPACPPPPPPAHEPPHEETPPGPEPLLEIVVEEEEPAPGHDGPPQPAGAPCGQPPAAAPEEEVPEPPLVAGAPEAPAPEPPTIAPRGAPDEDVPQAPLIAPPPPVAAEEAPEEAVDDEVPEPPHVLPETPTQGATEGLEAHEAAEVPVAPEVPAAEPPPAPHPSPRVGAGVVAGAAPEGPRAGGGASGASLGVAAAAGGAGSWFADLAHWEPLARDARARPSIAEDGAARPPLGLSGALRRARRFLARLLRRGARGA